jgi:cysteine-rich repeat protein
MTTKWWHLVLAGTLILGPGTDGRGADRPKPVCGNGIIEPGESCDDGNTRDGDSCPANCHITPCKETTGAPRRYAIVLVGKPAVDVSGVTIFVRYPEGRIGIPSGGSDEVVRRYIGDLPDGALAVPNDLDYGLREVIVGTKPLPIDKLFTVGFQDCEGAGAPPTPDDLSCTVEDAADSTGTKVAGLTCVIRPA